ncbi:hypothetical protein BH23ACT5_BH23ACT5_01830 [soil metagenome]
MTTMTEDEAADYWRARHERVGTWSSGNIALSDEENLVRYQMILSAVLSSMGLDRITPPPRTRLLDAGAGKGWFTDRFQELGFDVTAAEKSPSAIASLRASLPRGVIISQVDIARHLVGQWFEVVLCLDVAFHITQDDRWESAITNLGNSVAPGGMLLLSDNEDDSDKSPAGYIVYRGPKRYRSLLGPLGFEQVSASPYPGEPGLALFRYDRSH